MRNIFLGKNQNSILYLAFFCYAVLTFNAVINHEMSRDEVVPWLIVRDTHFLGVFDALRYQLHPALWYLMLCPFAKIGLPCIVVGLLNYTLSLGLVIMLLWKSPFPKLTSILAIFSFYIFWQYSIDARGIYILGLLILFTIACLYETRHTKPILFGSLIFLLANCNVTMFPTVAGLLAVWFAETVIAKKTKPVFFIGFSISTLGFIYAAWQVGLILPPSDFPMVGITDNVGFQPYAMLKALCGAFFAGLNPIEFLAVPAFIVLLAFLWFLKCNYHALAIFLIHMIGNLVIIGFKPMYTSERHYGIILMGIIFCFWIMLKSEAKIPFLAHKTYEQIKTNFLKGSQLLNLCFIASLGMGFFMHYYDSLYKFSGCKDMAEFLQKSEFKDLPIASHRYGHMTPVAAYLPGKKFWYAGTEKEVTYVLANHAHLDIGCRVPYDQAIRKSFAKYKTAPFLLLLDTEISNPESIQLKLLYKVDRDVFGSDERCYLYIHKS